VLATELQAEICGADLLVVKQIAGGALHDDAAFSMT